MSSTSRMLPESIRRKAAYLSEHFDDPDCRRQLKDLIHEVLRKDRNNNH